MSLRIWLFLQACISVLFVTSSAIPSPRPLVLWHGLGDSHSSPGMLEFMALIKKIHPGIFIHSIYIDEDLGEDRKAGFYGNINEQLEFVAGQVASVPELRSGFDAVGLSQGGQFLRAYVERYNTPPVNNLITFGSQHMGISDIPLCRPYDFLCQLARRATKAGVYTAWAQNNLVQAQYFRDPNNYETYLEANHFLPLVNNEIEGIRNQTYRRNLASLSNLVLVIFTEDKTVVPKESAWFGSEVETGDYAPDSAPSEQVPLLSSERTIIPMREQPMYVEDWIGLRELDERGGITFASCVGEHMQMGDCWEDLIVRFTGGH